MERGVANRSPNWVGVPTLPCAWRRNQGLKGAKLLEGGAAESWSCSVLDALEETRGRNGRCGWISDALVLKGARELRAAGAAVRNTEEGASGSDRADAHVDARWVASHRDRL